MVTLSPAPGVPAGVPVAPAQPVPAAPHVVRAFQFPLAIEVQFAADTDSQAKVAISVRINSAIFAMGEGKA